MGASGKRRKVAYDEEDDGFMFTRTRSKAKAASAAPPQPPQPAPPRSVRKQAAEAVDVPEPTQIPTPPAKERKKTATRSTRNTRGKEVASEQDAKERKENEAPTPTEEEDARSRAAIDAQASKQAKEKKGKKVFTSPATKGTTAVVPRRRSARLSGESAQMLDQQSKPRTRRSLNKDVRVESSEEQPPAARAAAEEGARAGRQDATPTVIERFSETKIALPFADTPVIKRNKELRKGGSQAGHRRSSVGLRGRRASSLIDSGTSSAMPHREVDASDFYKHIEGEGLPEPRRMRQLLMWCATRALGEKPSYSTGDGNARLAARVIQEELLKDFSNRGDLSDWFSRDDDSTPAAVVVKKPNPRNETNAVKVQELEAEIKRIKEERKAWEALTKPPDEHLRPPSVPPDATNPYKPAADQTLPSTSSSLPSTTPLPAQPPLSASSSSTSSSSSITQINSALLDPEQAQFLESLTSHPNTAHTTRHHLNNLASGLEFNVDLLAEGIHHLSQYRETADRVAGRVLAVAAEKLDERDTGAREAAGTRDVSTQDVLRSLSRVDR